MMWTNKHVVMALLIAPMLGIIAWFSVDYFVAERPQAAKPGSAYPLVAKPNCRRSSPRCELSNKDFQLTIEAKAAPGSGVDIVLTALHRLDSAAVAVAVPGSVDGPPTGLTAQDAQALHWQGHVPGDIGTSSLLRIAVTASASTYFAEVPVTFFHPPSSP